MGATESVHVVSCDDGCHVEVFRLAGDLHVTRRDDLRGIWQVDGGDMYPTRQEAVDAAVKAITEALDAQPTEGDEAPVKG